MAGNRSNQVRREHLNDEQWAAFCRLMELTVELKRRIREKQRVQDKQEQGEAKQ